METDQVLRVSARVIQRHVRGWLIRRWGWYGSYFPRFPCALKARWAARFRHDYGEDSLDVGGGVEALNAAHYAVLYSSPIDLSEALRFGANPFQRDVHGFSVFGIYAKNQRRSARHDAIRELLALAYRHWRAATTLQAFVRLILSRNRLAADLDGVPSLCVLPTEILTSHVVPMAVPTNAVRMSALRAPPLPVMARVHQWRCAHPYGWIHRCCPAWGIAGCPMDLVETAIVEWRGYPWERDNYWPTRHRLHRFVWAETIPLWDSQGGDPPWESLPPLGLPLGPSQPPGDGGGGPPPWGGPPRRGSPLRDTGGIPLWVGPWDSPPPWPPGPTRCLKCDHLRRRRRSGGHQPYPRKRRLVLSKVRVRRYK